MSANERGMEERGYRSASSGIRALAGHGNVAGVKTSLNLHGGKRLKRVCACVKCLLFRLVDASSGDMAMALRCGVFVAQRIRAHDSIHAGIAPQVSWADGASRRRNQMDPDTGRGPRTAGFVPTPRARR